MGSPLRREDDGSTVIFGAEGKTDFFRDPASETVIANAPFIYEEIVGDFTLTVTVSPRFASTYDAGAILLFAAGDEWLKLAYENTDLGYPAIVSVATRGKSDDCNGEPWSAGTVTLRMSRRGNTVGCYYGESEEALKMHRLLIVPGEGSDRPIRLGLSVQSPTGEGCRASFEAIRLERRPVADMRKGSF